MTTLQQLPDLGNLFVKMRIEDKVRDIEYKLHQWLQDHPQDTVWAMSIHQALEARRMEQVIMMIYDQYKVAPVIMLDLMGPEILKMVCKYVHSKEQL